MTKRLLFQEAETHFREHGDSIKFKDDGNPNASYDVVRGDLTVYAYGRTKDWMDAEDAVQEAYLRVLENGKEENLNFGGLYKITLDHCIVSKHRRDGVRNNVEVEDEFTYDEDENRLSLIEQAVGNEADPLQLMEVQEKIDYIMEKSNKMNHKAKGIIRMSLIFGYTNKEIAEILNIKPKKVANTLVYFRKQMEEMDI